MAKLCELKVLNQTNGQLVVGPRILPPKKIVPIPFRKLIQVRDAMAMERAGSIKFKEPVPADILRQLGILPEAKKELIATPPEETEKELIATPPEENQGELPEEVTGNSELEESQTLPLLTRQEILDMTGKEIKDFVKDANIEVDIDSRTLAKEATNKLLALYGYEIEVGE